jgi:hypothetical protein
LTGNLRVLSNFSEEGVGPTERPSRTQRGRYSRITPTRRGHPPSLISTRAEVADHPRLVIEHDELSEVVEDLKRNLDAIVVMPDGRLLLVEAKRHDDADEAAARSEVERTAMRNESLDALIDRYPVPAEWGNESGWSDVL